MWSTLQIRHMPQNVTWRLVFVKLCHDNNIRNEFRYQWMEIKEELI